MGVCDVPGISYVCEKAGEAAASLVSAPFDWLASAMGSAAGWLFEQIWDVFETTTLVDLTNPAYRKVYALLFGVAVMVVLVFFCLQLVLGLVRREPGATGRALAGLGKAILGSFLLLTITGLLLAATDQICTGIIHAAGESMESMGTRIAALAVGLGGITLVAPGAGAILMIFLGGLAITAALVVWFSLLVRKALLLVGLVFGPIALAGAAWDATRGWFGKWASFLIAMIVSKLVLVVTLLVGVSLASSPLDAGLSSVSDAVTGVVVMLIAAFAPYMAHKFVSFIGTDVYQLMSAEQEAKTALDRPVPVKPTPTNPPSTLGDSSGATTPPPPAPASTPAASAGPEAASSGGVSAGTSEAAADGAAGTGPAGLAVMAGAAVAAAGPGLGQAVGGAADQATGQAAPPPQPTVTTFTPTSTGSWPDEPMPAGL